MLSRPRVDTPEVFSSLADIVRDGSTPKETYAAVCIAATLEVPKCDHASLIVRRGRTCNTVGVSDPIAGKVDTLQLALKSGPCIDAIETQSPQIEQDFISCARWPTLAQRVVAETPVRAAISVQLPIDRSRVGAFNLFSDTPLAFDEQSVERALVLGAFARTAAIAAAQAEDVTTLRRGLANSRTIGKAIGMLMVLKDVSDDDAFDILRRASQANNVKLADIATDFVRRRSLAISARAS